MIKNNSTKLANLLIVDPNPCGTGALPLEKLNIEVELKVYPREDDIIIHNVKKNTTKLNSTRDNSDKFTTLSFINNNGTEDYLTTNYTELNTKFNTDNPDLETLGIESIDISFNTSYVPIVKIKFKDIRGQLFEQGNDSPYSFLFKMPYPIFYLTIKGYYGKPVSYALHMTKFSGALDNSTGSFLIDCEFIGYTYAFLTDILMGYIKAIPYTDIGTKLMDNDFVTIDELLVNITKLNNSIESYKNDDKKLASLTIFMDLIVKLDRITKYITDTINKFKINSAQVLTNNDKVEFLKESLTEIDKTFYTDSIISEVKRYIEYVNSKKITKYTLNEDDFKLDSDGVYYNNLKMDTIVSESTSDNPKEYGRITIKSYNGDSTNNNKIENFLEVDTIEENFEISNAYSEFQDLILSDNFFGKLGDPLISTFNILDFRYVIKKIDSLKSSINDELKLIKKEVIDEFILKIEADLLESEIDFDPSIGSFFKILSSHVDLFLNSIKSVSEEVKKLESKGERKRKNLITTGLLPEVPNNDDYHVKAFPEYLDYNDNDNDKSYTDAWIGNNYKFSNSPEVIFINNFYEAILKSGKRDKEFIKNSEISESGWIPVNPFDSRVIDKKLVNPWSLSGNSSEKEIFKLLIQRMVIFLGYSNKNLQQKEIIDMAKIEADQSFNAIINDITKIGITPSDFEVSDTSRNSELSKRIALINESNQDNYRLSYQADNDYDDDINTDEAYIFYGKNFNSDSYTNAQRTELLKKEFLPITQTSSQLLSEDNPYTTPEKRTTDEIFTSRLIGGDNDDGETFIKILNKNKYENNASYESYDTLLTNKSKSTNIRLTTRISGDNTDIYKHNYILGGIFGTHEFMKYQSENGETDSFYEFYDNKGGLINYNRVNTTSSKYDTYSIDGSYNNLVEPCFNVKTVKDLNGYTKSFISLKEALIGRAKIKTKDTRFNFQPGFTGGYQTTPYSLFGSDFYNSQESDIAKAFLFLHTIPFEGMDFDELGVGDKIGIFESKIKNFFNQRAGIVEVPHSWLLFIGALLHRASDSTDIIKFNNGYNLILGFSEVLSTTQYLNTYRTVRLSRKGSSNLALWQGHDKTYKTSISKILLDLPKSVKVEFINLFKKWVGSDSGFKGLQKELEIFTDTSIVNRVNAYNSFVSNNEPTNLISDNIGKNYRVVSPYSGKDKLTIHIPGKPINFLLELRDDGPATNLLSTFLNESKIIVNGTYRIWEEKTFDDGGSVIDYTDISIDPDSANTYLREYLIHFRKLVKTLKLGEEENDINRYVFNTTNVDDIKIKLYKNVKSIHDKWVVGVDGDNSDIVLTDIFDRFTFIDRSYTDIGNLFKIAPTGMARFITESTNMNFYNFIARILADNNFDFIPLPTYTNYDDPEKVAEIFKPQTFNESDDSIGPQFICMYIGERSNKLNIEEQYGVNKDDGWKVHTSCNNGVLDARDSSTIPKDFLSGGTHSIPYFLVKYGDQNQSMFKNIKVDQMEFTETDEGLQIIEDLGSKNRNNSVGQNLFDIYQNRSYSAEVDMLGCAQIQPFMYFQLDNIPMFTGAYTIINTRHSIKPNHMSTSFKGVRVRYGKTKMVDVQTLYLNLIGNIADISNEGVFYTDSQTEYINTSVTNKSVITPNSGIVIENDVNIAIPDVLTINPPFKSSDRNLSNINTVVLHWTGGSSITSSIDILKSKNLGYHFLIDKDGKIYQGADVDKKVSHGGNSYGPNGNYVNSSSIGISFGMLGSGDDKTFSDNMYTVCANLISKLKGTIPTIKFITGHHWVSPGRKIDPYTFDFFKLRSMIDGDVTVWKTEDSPFPEGLTKQGTDYVGPGNYEYSKKALSKEFSDQSFNSDNDSE